MVSGAYNRKKGHDFEREVAKEFRAIGYTKCKRHLEVQKEEALGYDLDNTGDYKVQLKRTKKYAPISAIEEIKAEGTPILITRANNKPTLAVIPFQKLLHLLQLELAASHTQPESEQG